MLKTFDAKKLGFRQTVKCVVRSLEAGKKRINVNSVVGNLLIELRDKYYPMKNADDLYTVTPWADARGEYIDELKLRDHFPAGKPNYVISITQMEKIDNDDEDDKFYEAIVVATLAEVVITSAVFNNKVEYCKTNTRVAVANIVKAYLSEEYSSASINRYDFAEYAVSNFVKSKYGKFVRNSTHSLIRDLENAYAMSYKNLMELSTLNARTGYNIFKSSNVCQIDFGSDFQKHFMIAILGLMNEVQYNTNKVVFSIDEIFNTNGKRNSIGFITMVKIVVAKFRYQA